MFKFSSLADKLSMAALAAALFLPASGLAYVPPSQYLLKVSLNRHSGAKAVKIRTLVTAYEDGKPTPVKFKETTFLNLDTFAFKSWASDETEKKLFTIEKSRSGVSPLSKLLLGKDLREVSTQMKDLGIPIRTEEELLAMTTEAERIHSEVGGMTRWKKMTAWTVGSSGSQLWFQQNTFLPIRLFYPASGDSGVGEAIRDYDFQMENYNYIRGFPFPRSLTLEKKDKGILLTSELIEFAPLTQDNFSNKLGGHSGQAEFTAAGEIADPAIKKLIQLYYGAVR